MSRLRVTEMFEIASKSTLKLAEKGLAAGEDVAIRRVEVAGVPGIGHVARVVGPIEQAAHLAIRIAVQNALETPLVLAVHIDDVVPVAVLRAGNLAGAVAPHGNPNLAELVHGAMMRRVADLLAARRSRVDLELVLASRTARQLLKNELGHRRPANIPVAYEENARHSYKTPDLRFYGHLHQAFYRFLGRFTSQEVLAAQK